MTSERWLPMFAIDGGNTTGLCYGCFPLRGTLKGRVARARAVGGLTFKEIKPRADGLGVGSLGASDLGELSVINQVLDEWLDWNERLKFAGRFSGGSDGGPLGLGPTVVLIEDFFLRTGVGRGRYVLSSVRVAYGFMAGSVLSEDVGEGMEWLHLPVMYGPSQTKSFATSERLKMWGLWKTGMPHARDAARLIALHLAKKKEMGS